VSDEKLWDESPTSRHLQVLYHQTTSMIFISGLLHCFTQLSSFILLAIPEMLRYDGALDSITARFFGVLAARFHLFSFLVYE